MPQAEEKEVKLPRAQTRASFVPSSFNEEKRTVDVVWSTGARGARWDWDIGRYFEELSMRAEHVKLERMNAGASVLNSHRNYDLNDVIGAIVPGSAVVDGVEGRATIQFSERDDVAGFVKDVAAGVIRHISVGYNVSRYELVEKVVEGENLIPVYRAVDWEPAEISFVPIPFDSGAQVRAGDGENLSKCVFINRGAAASNGGNMEKTPEQIAAEQEQARREQEQRDAQARAAGAAALRQLMADVKFAVRALPEGDRATVETELLADESMTADKARAAVLTRLTENQPEIRNAHTANIQTIEDARDKYIRGAGDWLIQRANVAGRIGDAAKNLQPGEFRGMRLADLARESLERAGVNTRGLDQMKLIGLAMTHRSGQNTTSDFAVLLENVMHKMLQGAFSVTPDTWQRFCATGTVSDFRAHNRYMMGTFGSLDSLNENGEFRNKQIPDGRKETISAGTKGNIIAISRQAIINDDMNAFASLATMFGRAAKLSIEKDVYAALALNSGLGPVLSDGLPIFDAAHANISTGAALSVDALDADRVQMGKQTDLSGNEILDLRPEILLISSAFGGNARVINGAQYDPDTANKLQKPNKVAGLFNDIVDTARLSGTRRYMFANPNVAPVIEVAFLDGQREPVLETKDGWNVDGTEMKVRLDYGVAGVGYHGAVTNAGV